MMTRAAEKGFGCLLLTLLGGPVLVWVIFAALLAGAVAGVVRIAEFFWRRRAVRRVR